MTKTFFKRIICLIVCLCVSFSALLCVACSGGGDDSSGGAEVGDKGHVRNPVGIGGEGILDDGGDINITEPVLTAIAEKHSGEHKIIVNENKDSYELIGSGTDEATWANSGATFNRIRCGLDGEGKEYGVIFKFDISSLSKIDEVGCVVTLIANRKYTCISVSADKINWTDIGYGELNGIKADYSERTDKLLDTEVSDSNLFQCYYSLAKYAEQGKPLYLKCGYSDKYENSLPSPVGTDVIAYVSWFESLTFEYEYL